MKTLFTIIICFTLHLQVKISAQELKPLKIGDKVPDVLLREMLNYKSSAGWLADLNTKPLIIDFWFVGCASCVELMPHLDSLQKEFKDSLQVLLSTFDGKKKVEDFFNNSRYISGIRFTQVVNDSLLRKLFPTNTYPHQVWIGKDGKVKAITDGKSATRENIEKFIKGEGFDFKPKIGEELDPNINWVVQPAITHNYEENKNKIINYSYLSSYREEFNSFSRSYLVDSIKHILRFQMINSHILSMYDFAYNGGAYIPNAANLGQTHIKSRFIREDSGKATALAADFKNYNEYYCYELICRYNTAQAGVERTISANMINDLDRALNIKSHTEKRMINFWVLKEYGRDKYYQNPAGNTSAFSSNIKDLTTGKKLIIQNISSLFFIQNLNQYSDIPFMSEVPFKGKMSFEVTWNPEDINKMSKELRKYGLDIALERRERDVIVLQDK